MSDEPANETTTVTAGSSPSTATSGSVGQKADKKRDQADRFRYGNFNRYYGVRTKGFDKDPRLDLLPPEWFKDRRVLDIGCNAGHLTLEIARALRPSWVLGIDIDDHLVGVARKNIRHYFEGKDEDGKQCIGKFPAKVGDYNVWFSRENYVLESDDFLEMVREEFDVILALSITKWVHLNWGDAGLKRFLRRTFLQLNPGGRLILEAQEFSKYYKRAKTTPDMFERYKAIAFKPDQFKEFLLSAEVGFTDYRELGVPKTTTKGFERPLMVFRKPHLQQNSSATKKRKHPKVEEGGEEEEKKGKSDESTTAIPDEKKNKELPEELVGPSSVKKGRDEKKKEEEEEGKEKAPVPPESTNNKVAIAEEEEANQMPVPESTKAVCAPKIDGNNDG